MKKKIIVGVIIVALVGIIAGIQISAKNKKDVTNVKSTKVEMGDVKMYLSTTATIESKNKKNYMASSTAKISSVKVKVGDKVKKGDTLLTYDTSDLSSQVSSAQIGYDNALSQKKDAVNKNSDAGVTAGTQTGSQAGAQTNASTSSAASQNSLSDEKIKQLNYAIETAKITLDSAKTKLAQNSSIISDIDGVATAVNVVSGQTGSQDTALVVQDILDLKAVVKVGKYDAAKVALGQDATIMNNGKSYIAKVSKIYPTATVNTTATGGDTNLTVELDVLEVAPQLKVNFDSDVDILLNQALGVVKVPAQAILTNKDGTTYLFAVRGGKAVKQIVKLGVQSDAFMEIVSGVKVGDSVILNPGSTVTDGIMVKESVVTGGK
ncbi:efflux RND transporter periplasmic adaptor subunit [Clostridium estertheticum]|uniref:efflux RND transporter periplasmic adaptor subunit n=1 Tax=Clostridium estertheticum TaxID=238834 RepID=UPI001C7DD363|nr:efflux RND transporter periplasmic adaptor subunit [Clostridium estertheticum]MBX4266687.1 efflux RND transporter periplasmic adaptor subunit [Clostridium estertheticum]WLC88192.1 efflux RND transporter periplasmic adaptor subunit [Clostridium estertheticum]